MSKRKRVSRLGKAYLTGLGLLAAAVSACDRSPAAALKVTPSEIRMDPGRSVPVRVEWLPDAGIEFSAGRVYVFVHVNDSRGKILRTFDHPLPEGWSPGKTLAYDVDFYESVLADPLAPGSYPVTMGLYDIETGYRWRLDVGGEKGEDREYRVATVEAAAPGASNPKFLFAKEWSAPEPYPDQQTIMLRWLLGAAAIEVREIPSAGTVRMRLKVEREPGIEVRNSCEPGKVVKVARGVHWVSAEAQPGECEIQFAPADPAAAVGMLARLEVVAWRPKGG
jgi:hypothetical protein